MLTVHGLLEETGLPLIAGERSAETPIRWVHISELLDPTPWLSGGELLLTTGIQLRTEDEEREYMRRLVRHQLAGLGFGTGLAHETVPEAIVDEAALLNFPLFEVPYAMPFIAITEKAFGRLVNEQYALLQRSIAFQGRLEQLVLDERGLDEVMRALSAAIGGAVIMIDGRGEPSAAAEFRRPIPERALAAVSDEGDAQGSARIATSFEPSHEQVAGRGLVLPIPPDVRGGPRSWLVAGYHPGAPRGVERPIFLQGATVAAGAVMRRLGTRGFE